MRVRAADDRDIARLAEMRRALWPDEDPAELDSEVAGMLRRSDYQVFVAEADGQLVGFAEVGVRSVAEGCSGPAAYLEGIWVEGGSRRRGVARALLAAGEQWARARGLTHFGSDVQIDNQASLAWHEAAGFGEVERLVAFARRIE